MQQIARFKPSDRASPYVVPTRDLYLATQMPFGCGWARGRLRRGGVVVIWPRGLECGVGVVVEWSGCLLGFVTGATITSGWVGG